MLELRRIQLVGELHSEELRWDVDYRNPGLPTMRSEPPTELRESAAALMSACRHPEAEVRGLAIAVAGELGRVMAEAVKAGGRNGHGKSPESLRIEQTRHFILSELVRSVRAEGDPRMLEALQLAALRCTTQDERDFFRKQDPTFAERVFGREEWEQPRLKS